MPLDPNIQQKLIENYRSHFIRYGDSPEACQWSSEGQRFRFSQLTQIAPLDGHSILDVGCGLGHLYPFLLTKFGTVSYTGVDIVPEMIAHAASKYPRARFLSRDLVVEPLSEKFDYVLMSGLFNNTIPHATTYLKEIISTGFSYCNLGLAFNFTSSHVNFPDPDMAYHEPAEVLDYCIRNVARRVTMHHHYENCDVAVFVYR